MKKIFDFLRKHHILWCSSFGLLAAACVWYCFWYGFDYTNEAYVCGATAFAGLSLLIYFDWGYHESEPDALGAYTGVIISYAALGLILAFYAYINLSHLTGVATALICGIVGAYLVVPIIKFFNDNK